MGRPKSTPEQLQASHDRKCARDLANYHAKRAGLPKKRPGRPPRPAVRDARWLQRTSKDPLPIDDLAPILGLMPGELRKVLKRKGRNGAN